VREACYTLNSVDRRIDSGLSLLRAAIQHGAEENCLRLIKALFAANRDSMATELLFARGRGLIEAVGFKNVRTALQVMRLRSRAGTRAAYWAKYLDGLSLLFDGQYQSARRHFEALVPEAAAIDPRCANAMRAEVLECDRRLGEITSVVCRFGQLYESWAAEEPGEYFETHFTGVTGFLLGHSLKAFGQHKIAFAAYDRAEQLFERFGTEADRVEALHCVYAKSVCMLPEAVDRDDGRRYAELAAQTESYFLRGLLHLAQARHLALRHEYEESLREILLAKSAFTSTTSVVYYQRACCAEAMLRSASGDFKGAVASVALIPPERAATAAVGTVVRVANAVNLKDPEEALKIVAERAPQLLQRGNLATVLSLLRVLEMMAGPLPNDGGTFGVPVLESSLGGKWEVNIRIFLSLRGLASGLKELLSLPAEVGAYVTIE
jgi:tetratricopeptide (TPR) repeat protein